MQEQELRAYAAVVLEVGLNFQSGKDLAINAWIEHAPFARILADEAYQRGAELVDVWYWDPHVKKSRLLYAPEETLSRTPAMLDARYQDLGERRGALVNIVGDPDPDLLKGVDPARAGLDRMPGLASRFHVQNRGLVEWVVVAFPTDVWAEKALGVADADRLWEKMKPILRLDQPDPVAAWKAHIDTLRQRAEQLNEIRFDAIHYAGPGTDLTIGLPARHKWTAAEKTSQACFRYVVNMPTEEVFTAPDPNRAEGVIRSTQPLALGGSLIEGLSFRFEGGRIVDVQAERGAEIVRGYIATDAGASRLGEIALVDNSSPVARAGVTFLNTLFDENATCHIAFGDGIRDGNLDYDPVNPPSDEQLGINVSTTHVDFMVGSPEVTVSGVHADGKRQVILDRDVWQLPAS
jgi:aminopeptidase